MHLAQNGSVLACGYTRFHPLGYYPKQSLFEIWFGEKRKSMKKSMLEKQFPRSCEFCKTQAEGGLFQQLRSRNYDGLVTNKTAGAIIKTKNFLRSGHFDFFPSTMSFELSNTCNLECAMCLGMLSSSIRKNRDKLPPLPQAYGPEILEELRLFIPHLKEALFFGGEPFLIDLYLDIWDLIIALNPTCNIYITTNGTILNARVKNIIESLPNLTITVSLDAATKHTYESIRVNAKFEKVMSNIDYFNQTLKSRGQQLVIKPTLMVQNAPEFHLLWDYCNREECKLDPGILVTPANLSLGNQPIEYIDSILNILKNHQATSSGNTDLDLANKKAFQVAVDHAAFWLEERKLLASTPQGSALIEFQPMNKMEYCLAKTLESSLRATKDMGLSLHLQQLWAEPGNKLSAWLDALAKLTKHIYKEENQEEIMNNIPLLQNIFVQQFDEMKQEKIIQHLLNMHDPWILLHALRDGDIQGIEHLVIENSKKLDLAQPEAAFF